ncbi:MAG: hypothetical protein F6K58_15530 [Symploca sp. SIO2E9]|nr:hypothetical protein [Symploca sp. SIO2E9]
MNTDLSPLQDQTVSQESVTFEDTTQELGITYSRVESPSREAAYDELRQQEVITSQDLGGAPLNSEGLPGVAILDYDNDNDLDIYVTNGPGAPNSLYSNQLQETGEFTFVDVAQQAGVTATDQDSSGVVYGDIDNDGDQDLLVLGTGEPNRLFENQGDGTFVDITEESGIGGGNNFSGSASFGDVNGDGLLDVVVANTFTDWNDRAPIGGSVPLERNEHNQLFINNGDNTFTDVSETSGIQNLAGENLPPGAATITHAIAMVDYDLDGDVDIIQADDQAAVPPAEAGGIDRGMLHVLENDGEGNFTDVTVEANLDRLGGWMGLSFGDFNSDGNLDIFASNGGEYTFPELLDTLDPSRAASPVDLQGEASSRWFLGQDDGTFEEPGVGELNATPFGWGTSTLDYENDGDTDIFFVGGHDLGPFVDASNPGALLQNDGDANFIYEPDVLDADRTRRNEKGSAVGDLNGDGFVDIVSVSNFNTPESIELEQYSRQFDSPFDATAQYVPTFTSTAPGQFVWNGLEFTDGTLSVEINSADNGNGWVEVQTIGTVGLTEDSRVNRDGIGAVVSFTPENGQTVMQPILGGSSYASQDSLAANFGLGSESSGTVEVLWSGGVRNRLYDVEEFEQVVFPEIPVSFDGDYESLFEYETLVSDAISELVDSEVLTESEGERFLSSAVRAFVETEAESDDVLAGTPDAEELVGSSNNETIYALAGDDTVAGGLGNDTIFGGEGEDILRGDRNSRSAGDTVGGDDLIYGGKGNDRIGGKAGDDELYGDQGDDEIWGDHGNDIISGGLGNDTVFGGAGSDTFVLAIGEGTDTIMDFEVGIDLIELAGGLTFGQLSIEQEGSNALLSTGQETLAILHGINADAVTEAGFTVA